LVGLDIRLLNTDRNDGNILVKRDDKITLIPVDHGYCLPDVMEIAWCDWVWLDWPQAKRPFVKPVLDYINAIDVEKDYNLLKKLGIREPCLKLMKIATMTLKKGAEAGLTLHQIGQIISRNNLELPSHLEVIVAQSRNLAMGNGSSRNGSLSTTSDDRVGPPKRHATNPSFAKKVRSLVDLTEYQKNNSPTVRKAFLAMDDNTVEANDERFYELIEEMLDDLILRKATNTLTPGKTYLGRPFASYNGYANHADTAALLLSMAGSLPDAPTSPTNSALSDAESDVSDGLVFSMP